MGCKLVEYTESGHLWLLVKVSGSNITTLALIALFEG